MTDIDFSQILSLPKSPTVRWEGGIITPDDLAEDAPNRNVSDGFGLALWCSRDTGLFHSKVLQFQSQSAEEILLAFIQSLVEFQQLHAFASRPVTIHCNDVSLVSTLNAALGEKDIAEYEPVMDAWNQVLQRIIDEVGLKEEDTAEDDDTPSLAASSLTEERKREFARAAAAYYKASLWDILTDCDPIEIQTPKPPGHMNYGVVLGAGRQNLGLGFFGSVEDYHRVRRGDINMQQIDVLSLAFDDSEMTHSADVKLWRELDLPLAVEDQYPTLHIYAKGIPKMPSGKQFEFCTLVLLGLAASTEAEIDTGQWTKTVTYLGKRKRLKFAIPNLLEPPSRDEWVRRGRMQPKHPAEEDINVLTQSKHCNLNLEQLIKVFDAANRQNEVQPDTPSNRATALFLKASDTLGRRRIQLARQALEEDENHFDALVMLGEASRQPQKRLEYYQRAVTAGREQFEQELREQAGKFWDLVRTRPLMRASYELAKTQDVVGKRKEAIELLQSLLRLDPPDHLGARHRLVVLLLKTGRLDEASRLLATYSDPSALWRYAAAVVTYKVHGRHAPESRKAMLAAFEANPHVVSQLRAQVPPPATFAPGTIEEAQSIIQQMMEVWFQIADYPEFMITHFFKWSNQ